MVKEFDGELSSGSSRKLKCKNSSWSRQTDVVEIANVSATIDCCSKQLINNFLDFIFDKKTFGTKTITTEKSKIKVK